MPLFYLGFNGFRQFASDSTEPFGPVNLGKDNFKSIGISWSKLSYISENGILNISSLLCEGKTKFAHNNKSGEENFVKVSCADHYLTAVTLDGIGKLYKIEEGSLKEIFKIGSKENNGIVECCIGDSDAVFINQAGRVVWISLASLDLESPILPIAWKVVSAACGKDHVLLLSETGTVYSFGNGSRGQLGHNCLDSEASPLCVDCLEGIRVTNVAAGGWHSAALTFEGDLYTWGWNESGQLGLPTKHEVQDEEAILLQATPTCVQFPEGVTIQAVSCGSRHTLVKSDQGALWAFGWNSYGQLGAPEPPVSGKPLNVDLFSAKGCTVDRIWSGGWSSIVEVSETCLVLKRTWEGMGREDRSGKMGKVERASSSFWSWCVTVLSS